MATLVGLGQRFDLLANAIPIGRWNAEEDGDQRGVELAAGESVDLGEGERLAASATVWPVRDDRIEGVGQREDPRPRADLLALESLARQCEEVFSKLFAS